MSGSTLAITNGAGGKDWMEHTLGWSAQSVAQRPYRKQVWMPREMTPEQRDWFAQRPPRTFQVLPRRGVVERTCSWHSQHRRLRKEYARLCVTSEALIYVAMIRLMLRRLVHF
jgi:transposase